MTVSPKTIAAIQRASHALEEARIILTQAAQQQATRVAEALSTDAFGMENDTQFEQWKSVARMSQSVQAMEEQLKLIYQAAGEIAFDSGASTKVLRLPQTLLASRLVDVSDVVAGEASGAGVGGAKRGRKPGRKPGKVVKGAKASKASKAAKAAPAVETGEQADTAKPVTGKTRARRDGKKSNADRVLDYLKTRLDRRSFGRVTHAEIAEGTPLPTGSVGAAVVVLKTKGLLLEGERGSYRLA
jgi:plasmid stability protein